VMPWLYLVGEKSARRCHAMSVFGRVAYRN
jgi:hypothetical protein